MAKHSYRKLRQSLLQLIPRIILKHGRGGMTSVTLVSSGNKSPDVCLCSRLVGCERSTYIAVVLDSRNSKSTCYGSDSCTSGLSVLTALWDPMR